MTLNNRWKQQVIKFYPNILTLCCTLAYKLACSFG